LANHHSSSIAVSIVVAIFVDDDGLSISIAVAIFVNDDRFVPLAVPVLVAGSNCYPTRPNTNTDSNLLSSRWNCDADAGYGNNHYCKTSIH